jgi:hypothetical protein
MIEILEQQPMAPAFRKKRWRYRLFHSDTPFGDEMDVPRRKSGFVRMTGQTRLGDVEVNDQGIPRFRSPAFRRARGRTRLGDVMVTDQGIPRFRSPAFRRARGKTRLGSLVVPVNEEGIPRYRSPAFRRARGRTRLGQEMTYHEHVPRIRSVDWRRARGKYRLGEADVLPLVAPGPEVPRFKWGFVSQAGRIRLGDFAEGEDEYNSYLDPNLVPLATSCIPMSSSGPRCVKYSQIDTAAQAQQYARRFFQVAVKYGLKVPDRSELRKLFNLSAKLYFEANRQAGQGGDLAYIKKELIGRADLNQTTALAFFRAGEGHSSWQAEAEQDPDVRELYDMVEERAVPAGEKKKGWLHTKMAGLPVWGWILFGAAGLGMYAIGKREEEEEMTEEEASAMMGLSSAQARFGRAAKGCKGLSVDSFRACMRRSLSGAS